VVTLLFTIGHAAGAFGQGAAPATSPLSPYGVVTRDPGVAGDGAVEQAAPAAVDSTHRPKRGEFVFAPMPMVNPTLENGLSVVAGYLYRLDIEDQTTAPSVTAVYGFKTSNGSWAGAVVQNLHLWHDRVRVLGVAAYGDINYEFFGIGQDAGSAGRSIELNQSGPVAILDGLVRVAPHLYAGARYTFMKMDVATAAAALPGGPTLPPLDATLRAASLGPHVQYDSRDNPFYPRHGMQVQGMANLFGKAVGGQRTYQEYRAWMNRYHAVGDRHVLAWHVGACGTDGSVPFYDLCLLGRNDDLRGYTTGQYRDKAMLAAQAEWRSELWWRFGATAFIGGGEVAPGFDSMTWDDVLPGGGVGLRFTLARRNHVNLRVDYAWGRDSSALYIGVGEAF
jgi:Omp85 superfamily domain